MLSSASPSVINSRPVFFSSLPDLLAGGGAAFFPADPLLRRCGLPLLPGAEPPLREADPGVAVARRLSAAGGVLRSAMALMVHAAEVGVAVVYATVLRGLRVETQRESVALSVLGLPTTAVCCRRAPSETGIRAQAEPGTACVVLRRFWTVNFFHFSHRHPLGTTSRAPECPIVSFPL